MVCECIYRCLYTCVLKRALCIGERATERMHNDGRQRRFRYAERNIIIITSININIDDSVETKEKIQKGKQNLVGD